MNSTIADTYPWQDYFRTQFEHDQQHPGKVCHRCPREVRHRVSMTQPPRQYRGRHRRGWFRRG